MTMDIEKSVKNGLLCKKERNWWSFLFLRRNILVIMAFFGYVNVYTLRTNLSVAIVAMTKSVPVLLPNGTIHNVKEFDWNPEERGYILSAFYYGYITTQIIGGWFGMKYGGAKIFGLGILTTSVLTMLTPFFVRINIYALIALRVVEGILEGGSFPCMFDTWNRWIPADERSLSISFAVSGVSLGLVITPPFCALIADRIGWTSIFYVCGGVGIIWWILWATFIRDNPEDDPWITEDELETLRGGRRSKKDKIKYPLASIFTSPAVYAVFCAHCCENYGFTTLVTQLPLFINDVFGLDIKQSGFLSGVPFMLIIFVSPLVGYIADLLVRKKILSITMARKSFTCIGFCGQFIFMVLSCVFTTPTAIIICMTAASTLGTMSGLSFQVNFLDLAPQYSAILMGFSNTLATLPSVIAPTVAGHIVVEKTMAQWRMVFLISGTIYLFGAIMYGIYGSGKVQPWAKINDNVEMDELKAKLSEEDCNNCKENNESKMISV